MEVRGNEINLFYLDPGLKVSDPALVVCVCVHAHVHVDVWMYVRSRNLLNPLYCNTQHVSRGT